ncbi:MAG: hypothetical protein U1F66_09440 [bacterium]
MKAFAKIAPLLFLLSALAAARQLDRRWNAEPYLRGADAYYYALQANYWAKTGAVKIPDSSVLHRITGTLQKLGWDSEGAVRAWESASLCLFLLLLLGLAIIPGRGLNWHCALLLGYAGLSPSLLFLAIEFPKFFLMLMALPLWFYPLALRRPQAWLAWTMAGGTCLLHRGALPLALAFSAGLLVSQLQERGKLSRKFWWLAALGTALAIGAAFFPGDRFRFLDLQRLGWQQPRPGLLSLLQRRQLPPVLKAEILVSLAFLGFEIRRFGTRAKGLSHRVWPLLALLLPALFPFGSEEVFGAGERYAILLPALVILGALSLEGQIPAETNWNWAQALCVALLAALAPLSASRRIDLAHPRSLDPEFASFASVTAELAPLDIPMLVAQKGLVFYYKFRLMREAFPYEPEPHWNKSRIWRVTSQLTVDELQYYAPEGCGFFSGELKGLVTPGFSLVREDCWVRLRAAIPREVDPDLYERAWQSTLNPSRPRPAFLYPKHAEDKDEEFPALPPKKI